MEYLKNIHFNPALLHVYLEQFLKYIIYFMSAGTFILKNTPPPRPPWRLNGVPPLPLTPKNSELQLQVGEQCVL